MQRSQLQNQLYDIIFGTDTQAGKTFDLILLIAIILSVFAVLIESLVTLNAVNKKFLWQVELFFTGLFTIEYIGRLYCAPNRKSYATSFYGIVDLCSILPTYIMLLIGGTQYFLVLRLLRVLRLFRILKLFRYSMEANILLRSMWQSRQKIQIFLIVVIVFATIFGAFMYVIEGPENGFTSMPQSIYWAIVTITTVGYGDISPHTPLGKALASMVMVLGYSIIAVPTGILTAELANEMRLERSRKLCKKCHHSGHEADALHCKYCGESLR